MSVNNWPTLKGVFPGPKADHKRDFLRENKVKIKDLQRTVSRKQLQLENDEIARNRRWRDKTQTALGLEKRSASLNKISSRCSCGSSRKSSSSVAVGTNDVYQTPRIKVCDKESQTDEICDETFLYSALQRCASTEPINFDLDLPRPYENGSGNEHLLNRNLLTANNSQYSAKLVDDFHNLAIDKCPSTATTSTTATTDFSRRKQRDREIRLPRYLEKEKREKEEQRMRDEMRDPLCPAGYYALSEVDRFTKLREAEKHFQDLVSELNRMPMTTETIRQRSRKVEIERHLLQLESEIRFYSKSTVYVKKDD